MEQCQWCDAEYTKCKPWQKFCSSECRNSNHRQTTGCKQRMRKYNAANKTTPMSRYHAQKSRAKARGVPFHLTFEDWWGLWEEKWDQRGKQGLCMSRKGDQGAYEVGNVYINTYSENCKEARLGQLSTVYTLI